MFYTNDERIQEFLYNKKSYPIVLVGSSLSGAFEEKPMFAQPFFNMYLPYTGGETGIEVIRRSNKIPRRLFIEINHIYNDIDTALISSIFDEPLYSLRFYLPFLLKKNRILPNLVDRIKSPHNNVINRQRPPEALYQKLVAGARERWASSPAAFNISSRFDRLQQNLAYFASKGCKITFYEVPMDSSLNKSRLLTYERNFFNKLAADKGYQFIKADTSRVYISGDGEHLLTNDANSYVKYFLSKCKQF